MNLSHSYMMPLVASSPVYTKSEQRNPLLLSFACYGMLIAAYWQGAGQGQHAGCGQQFLGGQHGLASQHRGFGQHGSQQGSQQLLPQQLDNAINANVKSPSPSAFFIYTPIGFRDWFTTS